MPLYQYECLNCGAKEDRFFKMDNMRDKIECSFCEGTATWLPSFSHSYTPFKSFVTKNVTGKPIEIYSLHELRRVEREHNVNFPAYGGSMLSDTGQKETHWTDEKGVTHRE